MCYATTMAFTRAEILEDIEECSRLVEQCHNMLISLSVERERRLARNREAEHEARIKHRLQFPPLGVSKTTCPTCGGEVEHRAGLTKPVHLGKPIAGQRLCGMRSRDMIVKVEVHGANAQISNEDGSVSMTMAVTMPLLARMNGAKRAFFLATFEHGGGKKDWRDGKGEQEYPNPVEIVDIGDRVKDQAW